MRHNSEQGGKEKTAGWLLPAQAKCEQIRKVLSFIKNTFDDVIPAEPDVVEVIATAA
jgi:hypothetical protein